MTDRIKFNFCQSMTNCSVFDVYENNICMQLHMKRNFGSLSFLFIRQMASISEYIISLGINALILRKSCIKWILTNSNRWTHAKLLINLRSTFNSLDVTFNDKPWLSWSWSYIVEFTTTYAISVNHSWPCEFESGSGVVYAIQHYVIKFVSDLLEVCDFHRVVRFPPPI